MKSIYDTIVWLKSEKTGRLFPDAVFTADTDAVTEGWVSLTSTERLEVVVTQATGPEWEALNFRPDGHVLIETRVNAALGRTDLKCPWLVRVDYPTEGGRAKMFFRDIYAEGSLAVEARKSTRRVFERNGGKVIVLERSPDE